MSKLTDDKVPAYVHKAHAAALEAEAEERRHAARINAANAKQAEYAADVAEFVRDREVEKRRAELNNDYNNRLYRFTSAVDVGSAAKCMDTLNLWARIDPGCDIEIVFFSPGGSVTDGMALFDTIQLLRRAGHHVTTTAIGMAASMGGILLQAGDVRRMTRESWVLIHQVQAGAAGSFGEIEDRVKWLERIQGRILDIFANRAAGSKAKKKLKREDFEKGWTRTDWWLSSDECLKHGIVDEVL